MKKKAHPSLPAPRTKQGDDLVMACMLFQSWVNMGYDVLQDTKYTPFFKLKISKELGQLEKWLEQESELNALRFGGSDEVQIGMNAIEHCGAYFLNIMYLIGTNPDKLAAFKEHLKEIKKGLEDGQEEQTASQGEPLRTA
jgi:hypothetical protein